MLILFHPNSIQIANPKLVLCIIIALVGGLSQPFHRFSFVLSASIAMLQGIR